ncbi:anti-sigma factor domain-containing protein [Sporolactobacillus sp. THM7-7]|nr:anti-sigma factor domain-containing protein [Sporolactobacillus sp. THM7-7]
MLNRRKRRLIDERKGGRRLSNQGILVSKHGRHAVLLTNDGDFKSVKLRRSADVSIGQTILSRHLSRPYLMSRYIITPVLVVGFSMLLLLPLSHSDFNPDDQAAAYVNIDLLPNIEASVDRNYQVLSVRPLNRDARQVISDPQAFQRIPFSEFSTRLFKRLNEMGYLNDRSFCVITAAVTNRITDSQREAFHSRLVQAFTAGSQELIHKSGIRYEWLQTSMAGRAAAEKRGISLGKYLLYLQANAYGKTMTLEEAKELSLQKFKEIGPSVFPWHKLMINREKSHGGTMQSQQRLSLPEKAVRFFQNPFQSVESENPGGKTSDRSVQTRSKYPYSGKPAGISA